MQVFLSGLVFAALLVLGVLTVWVQSESLQLGYEIESMRDESDALRRENDALRMRLATMKTPASLLEQDDNLLASNAIEVAQPTEAEDRATPPLLMPDWNVVWVNGLFGENVELARLDRPIAVSDLHEVGEEYVAFDGLGRTSNVPVDFAIGDGWMELAGEEWVPVSERRRSDAVEHETGSQR